MKDRLNAEEREILEKFERDELRPATGGRAEGRRALVERLATRKFGAQTAEQLSRVWRTSRIRNGSPRLPTPSPIATPTPSCLRGWGGRGKSACLEYAPNPDHPSLFHGHQS